MGLRILAIFNEDLRNSPSFHENERTLNTENMKIAINNILAMKKIKITVFTGEA